MKKKLRAFYVVVLITGMASAVFSSCKKDGTVDTGYSYFPDAIGHYCIYDVDSTVYDDFNNDTVVYRYEVKEIIESYFTDNQGRQAMRVERYRKNYSDTVPYANQPWTISRVWSFVRTSSEAEKQEENQRYIRLTFVPREGKTWNGNAYNTLGEMDYKYASVDQPYSLNAMNFDSVATVLQEDETNLITRKFYQERYARNVGMIEKSIIDVHGRTDTLILSPVMGRITGGVVCNFRLVDWGPR
ncbi:MAG TPA: hypothetical protein VFU15_00200 [Bacteroidia bacterium]|nr:hypothetical protein [Bacteroidia bacterium]